MPAWCRARTICLNSLTWQPGSLAGRVAAVRREEGQRVVAPVIGPPVLLAPEAVGGKLVHRHQLDRRDAQRLQVGNLLDHAQVRARCSTSLEGDWVKPRTCIS